MEPTANYVVYKGVTYPKPVNQYTLYRLSRLLKANQDWVTARINEIGASSQTCFDPEQIPFQPTEYYSADILLQLQAMRQKHQAVKPQHNYLSFGQLAEHLGCSIEYAKRLCRSHDIPVSRRRSRNNRIIACVAPTAVRRLGAVLPNQVTHEWWSIAELSRYWGCKPETATRLLKQAGYQPQWHRAGTQNHSAPCYPESAKRLRQSAHELTPPSGWLLTAALARRIGVSESWLRPRLRMSRYLDQSRLLRSPASGRIVRFYPPSMVAPLKSLAAYESMSRAMKAA